ncbi:uncharacterized protein LOC112019680 [Quercus suber]|uniref:uncharacterized protein LOC112019680 n=1 Tax=Quercus suber TaxID=58331 RepID=UPI000CE1D020|nr:uncharacterized protein LOC112019680 [Quercus suber]
MRFDGSATTASNGVGVVLSCEDRDTISLSFKLGFFCSNNAAEYEAYLTRLIVALSTGVKHMRVLGDSNLVVSQVKGDFAPKEKNLAAYRTWAQRLEQEFQTFSIEYMQKSENRFVDVLATLGSKVPFKGSDTLVRIGRQEHSILKILQKISPRESKKWDWRSEVKEKMKETGSGGSVKELKGSTLIEGELYRRQPGGILSKCINEKEGKLRLEELHTQVCETSEKISLYRRMQRMGYY